jgi:inorganic pyrophosphatase
VLEPLTFSFLLIGAMLPYWFSAMTMKSVGEAAGAMVEEVRGQVKDTTLVAYESGRLTGLGMKKMKPGETVEAGKGILEGLVKPDYKQCIDISTKASLREMVPPSALVIIAPLLAGTFFGVYAVFGILTGGLVSGVQLAISMSNTGGAWDNAKKFIEGKHSDDPDLQGKGTEVHKAAVVGDTVGDPLKDTSGPALNILMKLMAILSLVFAEYFKAINEGRGLLNIPVNV